MKLHGWCARCKRSKRVLVRHPLHPGPTPIGICDECETYDRTKSLYWRLTEAQRQALREAYRAFPNPVAHQEFERLCRFIGVRSTDLIEFMRRDQ